MKILNVEQRFLIQKAINSIYDADTFLQQAGLPDNISYDLFSRLNNIAEELEGALD